MGTAHHGTTQWLMQSRAGKPSTAVDFPLHSSSSSTSPVPTARGESNPSCSSEPSSHTPSKASPALLFTFHCIDMPIECSSWSTCSGCHDAPQAGKGLEAALALHLCLPSPRLPHSNSLRPGSARKLPSNDELVFILVGKSSLAERASSSRTRSDSSAHEAQQRQRLGRARGRGVAGRPSCLDASDDSRLQSPSARS
jgi:hypothetical protein